MNEQINGYKDENIDGLNTQLDRQMDRQLDEQIDVN